MMPRTFTITRCPIPFIVVVVVVTTVGVGSRDVSAETRDEFTARVTAELERRDPAAAAVFKRANLARNRDEWAKAEELYREVLRLEPDWVQATRRLCHVIFERAVGKGLHFERKDANVPRSADA